MTLTSTKTKELYDGDGVTTSFPTGFIFWDADDVRVVHRDALGAETPWTRGTQYTITGGGGASGSVEVVTSPTDYTPASGEKLVVKSDLPLTQPTAIPAGGKFPSVAIEQQLDQVVRQVQQMDEALDRSIKFSETSVDSGVAFPDIAGNANKVLAVNTAEDKVEFIDLTSLSNLDALLTSPDEDDFIVYDAVAGTWKNETLVGTRVVLDCAVLSEENTFVGQRQTLRYDNDTSGIGPTFSLHRNSASPAVNDNLGGFEIDGEDDGGERFTYGRILGLIKDPTAGSQDGSLVFYTAQAGSLQPEFQVGNFGTFTNAAVGGGKGNGTFNATAHYIGPIFWSTGTGTPEGVVTAPVGSLYSRDDGGAGTSLYVKESGTGAVGWVAK